MRALIDWTPERVEQLFEMWKAGHSAAHVAKAMGLPSRSAVIGKWHRMGWTSAHPDAPERTKDMIAARGTRTRIAGGGKRANQNPVGPRGSGRAPVVHQTVKSQLKSGSAIFPIQMNPTRFIDLERDQCRFPIDDVNAPGTAETLFCGAKQKDVSSYCEHHHARCMTPYKRRKKPLDRSKIAARDRFVFGVAA